MSSSWILKSILQKKKILDKDLEKLPSEDKRYTVKLGSSLFVRVEPSGHKSFVLRYSKNNKVKDITLGSFPEIKLVQAKQLMHEKREELELNPSAGSTFNDAVNIWKSKKKGTIVSYKDELRRIELYLLPKLRNIELEKITAPLIFNLISEFKDRRSTQKRLLMRINEILDLAVCSGLLKDNPCRRLSKVIGPHVAVNRNYLPADRLGEIFRLLKGEPQVWFHLFVLWAVYCMLRPIECVSIKWNYISGDTLTLPDEIMKKRRVHRVPLVPEVELLLKVVKAITPKYSRYVWKVTAGDHLHKQHLSKWLNSTVLRGKVCHHGLRATARTWMKDMGVSHEVAEDALAHVSGSVTERAYLRSDYFELRKPVMGWWWQHLFSLYCAECADDKVGSLVIRLITVKCRLK